MFVLSSSFFGAYFDFYFDKGCAGVAVNSDTGSLYFNVVQTYTKAGELPPNDGFANYLGV